MSKLKTWHLETAAVASVLLIVALVSGGGRLELLGVAAVVVTFGHASISNRLMEREAVREICRSRSVVGSSRCSSFSDLSVLA